MLDVVDTLSLERHILATIPLARAMELKVAEFDGNRLALAAPLAPNVNDKGCAFGGSLGSLLTLAGWGLIVLHLGERECDVYVQDSQMRYLAPVWQDFDAMLDARGRARLRVHCRVPLPESTDACTLEARFVAIARR